MPDPKSDYVMADLPDFLKQNCLVVDANGTVSHGPCDGSRFTNTPYQSPPIVNLPGAIPVPVYSAVPGPVPVTAIPGVTPAAAVSPASSLMPLLLVGAVLWFMTKN